MDVFVVEDSPIVRRLIVRRLEAIDGTKVVGEATGQHKAFALIRSTQPDVVLVDLTLDSGTGLGLVAELRASGFGGYIAILSAQNLEQLRDACVSAGADDCHDKGTGMESLFNALEVRSREMLGLRLGEESTTRDALPA